VDRLLSPDVLVIADGERSLGIAGILGGADSEIRPETTRIALECASFEPRGIGRTATALGLQVVDRDPERNLLLIRGAIPGATGGIVVVRPA